ncbi:hypothetical protein PanWU01x14_347540 [Parasponia andersonii]|uniref:Uncharacterized protein n=1 Tax=Parasponia andersonii TaxID=3476 RepID=A0A2P5AC22_PARAD|nr:hypothetical protein PanWU01x14_347540 [Parasponia andersonii]
MDEEVVSSHVKDMVRRFDGIVIENKVDLTLSDLSVTTASLSCPANSFIFFKSTMQTKKLTISRVMIGLTSDSLKIPIITIGPDPTAPRSTSTAPLPRSSADGRRSRSSTVHNSSSETVLSATPASNRYFQAVKHVKI